ncbi:exo-alpha-sialidase [Klebsiella variicola subsp. variicola]|nr:exo-alpha-sialidase [Klebsiella variicola subsp. variicola]
MLFQAPDNVLWLLWTAQFAGNQDTAIVRYRLSHDGGRSWGPSIRCWINRVPLFASQ